MNVLDVLNSPWAILPDKLAQIRDIYFEARARHAAGEPFDPVKFNAEFGKTDAERAYEVVDGVALIPIAGVIARRMNLFAQISGGCSSQILSKDFNAAIADPKVHSLLLLVDSPGGEVQGTQEVANQIFAARGDKPIVALCEGMMASAAYWIASAADKIFISSETVQVGSIGVIASHTDASRAEQMRGIKVTEITAGKYKSVGSPHAPLSSDDRDIIQADVDYLYSVFVNDVARARARSVKDVLAMADGKIFLGRQALESGLADDIATTGAIIRELAARRPRALISNRGGPMADDCGCKCQECKNGDCKNCSHTACDCKGCKCDMAKKANSNRSAVAAPKGNTMLENANNTAAVVAGPTALEIEAFKRAAFDEGFQAGGKSERERIKAVEGAVLPGHEALISELKFDGKTSGAEAALRVVAAERTKLGRIAENLRTDAPDPAAHVSTDRDTATGRAGESAAPKGSPEEVETAAKADWAKGGKLHREFVSEASYVAFRKAEARGSIRILSAPKRAS